MSKKILFLGLVWPEPNSTAAGKRMLQLLHLFLDSNYTITFASPADFSTHSYNLSSLPINVKKIEINHSSFDSFIKELYPDIVLFDRFLMEEQLGWRVAELCPNALRILDTEDLHFLRKAREQAVKAGKSLHTLHLINETTKRELASIYRCDVSLLISEAEMQLLQIHFNISKALLYYLPFIENTTSIAIKKLPNFLERNHFLFIGNFLHAPNVDGVMQLKSAIWPLIQKALPKTELHIYGAYTKQKIKQLHNEKERFLVKGYVENASQVLQNARIHLAYLRFGAGLKGKLITAMHNGTPCGMTTIAAEGMFGNQKPNGFIADSPVAFATKAIALYNNGKEWKNKQENGYAVLQTRFNKTTIAPPFIQYISELALNLERHRAANFIGQILQHHTLQSTKYLSKWIAAKNKKN